jgi:tRNA(adenine34) deaminase
VKKAPRDWTQAMTEALALARQAASEDEVPVGAVVVETASGRIVGRGRNRREADQNPLGHAEILAIGEAARSLASWRLSGHTLVVTLEPCPMCLAACQQARVDEVVYGAKDPKGGALSLGLCLHEDARTNHRFPATFAESSECGAVLTEFFRAKRN